MIDFKFADIGEGIHEGTILKWNFEVGDEVEEGETLCVIETDKVNAEIPAPESGTLKKRGAEVGETIHVGNTLAIIDDGTEEMKEESPGEGSPDESSEDTEPAPEETDDDADEDEEKSEEKDEQKEAKSKENDDKKDTKKEDKDDNASVVGAIESSDEVMEASTEHLEESEKETINERVIASPVARKMAKDLGVDLTKVKGSGDNGRIMKADIKEAAEESESKETSTEAPKAQSFSMPDIPEEGTRREKISKLRQTIVNAMNRSNQLIPATTVMDEFDVTELVNFRKNQKEAASEHGVKLTYLPLIIKAIVLTLKDYPVFNASFDHESEEMIYKEFYNIGIAVDTEKGLIVPNIKNADQKSIFELAKEIDTLADNARNGKIQLKDLKNTTFSITNYGAFGSKLGTPVINHPEVAILGMGAITKKPVVIDDEIVVRSMFPVSLTIDHRVIDGGDAGRFMVKLRERLSDPITLLLS